MNPRAEFLRAIVLLAGLAAGCGWLSSKSTLTVHLRCDGTISGTLSVAALPADGQPVDEQSYDLGAVCGAGELEFASYRSEGNLRFALARPDGEQVTLTAEYGRDVQRDQDGFYTVLRLTNAPPFIANDRI
ncbi:MAG: hypothetical protein OEU09_20910 [Rhodospirillales bacterium]|nr:hypothetical protein [Rhodospirillales bacterium]